MFHNRHLLDVGLWLRANSTELVTVRKIAAALGLGDGTVRPVVTRLEHMGLARSIRGVSRQEVPIEMLDSPLWDLLILTERHRPGTGVEAPPTTRSRS